MRSHSFCAFLLAVVCLVAAYNTQAWGEQPSGPVESSVDPGFLGHYATAEGAPSIDIVPSDKEGEVKVLIRGAYGGSGQGDLLGEISADGHLRVTGNFSICSLLAGCSQYKCNITAHINDKRLTGSYEFLPLNIPGTAIGNVFEPSAGTGQRSLGTMSGNLDMLKMIAVMPPRPWERPKPEDCQAHPEDC